MTKLSEYVLIGSYVITGVLMYVWFLFTAGTYGWLLYLSALWLLNVASAMFMLAKAQEGNE